MGRARKSDLTNDPLPELRRLGVVPVIVLDDPARAGRLAKALLDGGLPCAEITFRTVAAAEALQRISQEYPDVLLGAGTVLTPEQAARARAAGARFVVSPGFNRRVVQYCQAHDLAVFPGVCTPTEIEAALETGLTVLKFFPAEPLGGLAFLEAIAAPYPGVEFIPTGGINADHLPRYLQCSKVVACGGSWMAPKAWIQEGAYDRICDAVRLAVQAVAASRGKS
jgi:2-dehydro-3-deoxyphosphogluconate aldolase/(4S)-4-hydroxy-2-oxoglutarate aldolase